MRVLGLDPSLRNFGFAIGEVDVVTHKLTITDIDLCETEKGSNGKTIRVNSDDLTRARMIYGALLKNLIGVSVVFAEIPVGSQSASAMKSYGVCVALIATINIPVVQLNPTEVKLAATGNKNATKQEMIDWATGRYPNLAWYKGRGGYGAKNEHLADAVASIHAGMLTDEFNMACRMMSFAKAS